MARCFILRGGRIVDPINHVDEVGELGIADGLVVPVAEIPDAAVVDLAGAVVCPGFIDMHVHLREPGQTHKEDIATGTHAAAVGGFSTVVAMPNTAPAIDSPEILADVLERIRRTAVVRVLQTATLTLDRAGIRLTDARALRAAGAVALTDDGGCIQDEELMLAALHAARAAGLPVIDHCEDIHAAAGGVMAAGAMAQRLGVRGQPGATEAAMVARDARLACAAGWSVHVQHLSSADSVATVREARATGTRITAEVTPHHLLLTDEACLRYGTNAKMNPPLRAAADCAALIAALRDGTIGVIATDHAPHTAAEKGVSFALAPFGIVGLETAVTLALTHLLHAGILTLPELVSRFTVGPREVLGLPYGTLSVGAPADITILDLDASVRIDTGSFRSRSRNCPYDGWSGRGKAVATLVGGQTVYSEVPGLAGVL